MDSTSKPEEGLPAASQSIYQAFSTLVEPRHKRGIRYPLALVLTIVTLAKLCGETEVRGIAQWAQYRAASLAGAFGLKRKRLPHWTTYSRILSQVDDTAVQQALGSVLACAGSKERQRILDGKSLRGTIPQGKSQGEHLLALYAPDARTVIAQMAVGSKENEIVVAPQVLAQASLEGTIVTGDAMFTQRDLSAQIVRAGGHYIWSVKDNQPHLLQMIQLLFKPEAQRPGHGHLKPDFKTITQCDKQHGRYERRTLTTSSRLHAYCDWPAMHQVFRLERYRQPKHRPATTEVVYGITSLDAASASPAALLSLTRRHWAIENQLHYVRDVSLREDACRLKSPRAQRVMAVLNNLVLALLPRTPFAFLPDAQRFFNAHLFHALALLL
jgi:predicted transposase YbfD/YdcC